MSNKDPRKYSQLDFSTILGEMSKILSQKEGPLADFTQSSYGRTLIELFAANVDMNNYWINQAFYESLLPSATKAESIYLGARAIGYSIRRPTPSKALFGIRAKRTGSRRIINVDIKKGTRFTLGNTSLIAADNVKFTITPDREDPNETGVMTAIKSRDGYNRNILIEGEFRTETFFSDGTEFQEFNIDDVTFSDWFGDRDPNYQEPNERIYRSNQFTTVTTDIGLVDGVQPISNQGDKLYWRISRRGFSDPFLNQRYNELQSFGVESNKEQNFTALLTTNNDGGVKLEFADGIIASIPVGTITVTYFATNGENGRLNNVFDSPIQVSDISNVIITDELGRESDITIQDLEFRLLSDVQGGLNVESLNSIKRNAPSVYANLDMLGNLNSYMLFLKTRYGFRYARAFGEDIINKFKNGLANIKYINVVRYSILRDLYEEKNGNVYLVNSRDYQVDGFKVPGLSYIWEFDYSNYKKNLENTDQDSKLVSIFNSHIAPSYFIRTGSELDTIHKSLNKRGMMTTEHSYVPPFVHHLDVEMDVVLNSSAVFSDIKDGVIQAIYSYLKDYTDFAAPVYKSNLISIVEDFAGVEGLNLKFKPVDNGYKDINLISASWFSPQASVYIDTTLAENNIPLSFEYTLSNNTTNVLNLALPNQVTGTNPLSSRIINYINYKIYDNQNPESVVSSDVINDVSGFIWSQLFSDILKEVRAKMSDSNINVLSDIITTMRTWDFNDFSTSIDDKIIFDTSLVNSIIDLKETTGNLYKYISYALEYIKFTRNVLRYYASNYIIDPVTGDATRFKNQYEIMQIRVLPENIKLNVAE